MKKRSGIKHATYANSAFRFYARHEHGAVKLPSVGKGLSDAVCLDWMLCHEIMAALPSHDRNVLCAVYRSSGPLPDVVIRVADEYGVHAGCVWNLITRATKDFISKKEAHYNAAN